MPIVPGSFPSSFMDGFEPYGFSDYSKDDIKFSELKLNDFRFVPESSSVKNWNDFFDSRLEYMPSQTGVPLEVENFERFLLVLKHYSESLSALLRDVYSNKSFLFAVSAILKDYGLIDEVKFNDFKSKMQ